MRYHAPSLTPIGCALLGVIACGPSATGTAPQTVVAPEAAPAPPPAEAVRVGSAACRACHPTEAAAWEESHHARAWTAPGPGDPVDPRLTAGPVVGWVGWEPLRQPLVDVGGGRIQAWERAWDPEARVWFSVFTDGRKAGDRGHWTGPSMTWNSQCAPCHATEVVVGWDDAAGTYATRLGEPGVGCEACHGPGSAHADGHGPMPHAAPGLDRCYGCHARRADLDPVAGLEGGGLDRFAPALVDVGPTFWPDGQVRDEDFEINAFLGSRMYQQGVRCGDCHEPHGGALRREGDALCLGCHQGQAGWQAHDHHDGAVACVDCHMPVTTYMQRHRRRDHGFPIPDPGLRDPLDIPDPCTGACHEAGSTAWAVAALERWGMTPQDRPHRSRVAAIEAARTSLTPPTSTLAWVDAEAHPTWRAVGLGVLRPWGADPEVRNRLLAGMTDADPLIRFAAVGSLPDGDPALSGPLKDPVRAVRVQAQRRLERQLGPGDPAMADLRAYLEANLDQPDPAVEYGSWLMSHRDARGLETLRRAAARWPTEPPVAHALAVGLAQAGDVAAAVAVLDAIVEARPDDPGLWDALGRARAGAGDVDGGIAALREAVRRDPTRARTWYNLGMLLDSSGRVDPALDAWKRAAKADPTDPDPPWAAALAEERRGRRTEALRLARQALVAAPDHPEVRALITRLEGP